MHNMVKVKLYTLSTCSHCQAAKRLLKELGIKYEFVDVDLLSPEKRRSVLKEVIALNPACSFPTIVIGEKVIVGNREAEIRGALGL